MAFSEVLDDITTGNSYQVPKEVGKVGAESSKFIEPIANRKDGIQAMFSRQKEGQMSPKKGSSSKRKRSITPDEAANSPTTPTSQEESKTEMDDSTACFDMQHLTPSVKVSSCPRSALDVHRYS